MEFRAGAGRSFLGRHFGLMFGGLWFVVGGSFLIGGILMWQAEQHFEREAVSVEGKVLTRDIISERRRRSDSGSRRRRSTEYHVTYRFETPDGASYEGDSEVDVHVWENLREQGPVTVRYRPDDPDSNRVAGISNSLGAIIMSVLGGGFAIVGGGIFAFTVLRRRSVAQLRLHGQSSEATVLGAEPTRIQINDVRQWRIRYRYRDALGHTHEAESGLLSPEEAMQVKPGDQGEVRYDRNRPAKSIWLGVPDSFLASD